VKHLLRINSSRTAILFNTHLSVNFDILCVEKLPSVDDVLPDQFCECLARVGAGNADHVKLVRHVVNANVVLALPGNLERDSPIVKHYSLIKNSCFVTFVNSAICS
jgi:hypothetical protein